MKSNLFDKIYGCLVGGIIGDSFGAPSECLTWQEIEEQFGWIDTFEGCGTDDTVIKSILTEAIIKYHGNITADEWAEAFVEKEEKFYPLYFAPVRNMYHKLTYTETLPVYAGIGNAPSSSSAMAIAPMGIINACNPRQAAIETYDVAGMIHQGEATACRDGACAVAAAVAEAMKTDATVDSILSAATLYLHKSSSREMIELINQSLDVAKKTNDYREYRNWFYENCLRKIICDSRETIPASMAIFYLADGDVEKAAIYSANFGRDSDTIATIVASIAGAFGGATKIRKDWLEQVEKYYNTVQKVSSDAVEYQGMEILVSDYKEVTNQFLKVISERNKAQKEIQNMIDSII